MRSLIFLLIAPVLLAAGPELIRVPGGGVQPEAAVDAKGTVHLIYLAGDPGKSDVFYVRRTASQASFSTPIRVNSLAGSAIAAGTVRGAHLAIGRGGRVHVAWNGSNGKMQYARMNAAGNGFEPQIAVMSHTEGLDGGGTLAADEKGGVFVAWGAKGTTPGEENRRVYLAKSVDDGATFQPETPITDGKEGACACCGMAAIANGGTLYFLYRAAGANIHRDIHLLTSNDGGATWNNRMVQPWELNACPMSTFAFARGDSGPLVAWENQNQVYFSPAQETGAPVPVPGDSKNRKHPSIAQAKGKTLLAWTEGTGWKKGGRLAWQEFDASGKPVTPAGTAEGVPVWGDPAVFAKRDGTFAIVY